MRYWSRLGIPTHLPLIVRKRGNEVEADQFDAENGRLAETLRSFSFSFFPFFLSVPLVFEKNT